MKYIHVYNYVDNMDLDVNRGKNSVVNTDWTLEINQTNLKSYMLMKYTGTSCWQIIEKQLIFTHSKQESCCLQDPPQWVFTFLVSIYIHLTYNEEINWFLWLSNFVLVRCLIGLHPRGQNVLLALFLYLLTPWSTYYWN